MVLSVLHWSVRVVDLLLLISNFASSLLFIVFVNVFNWYTLLQEGPHSTLPDDEFYDAVETGFDKMEEERVARVPLPAVHTRDEVDLPPPTIDNRITVHSLWPEVNLILLSLLFFAVCTFVGATWNWIKW